MELKLIFSCIIICFYFTGANADRCKKPNERYCNDQNRCESACTYQDLTSHQFNRTNCICINGFARNKNGDCVEPRECVNFCGKNEQIDKEAIEKNATCTKYCKCKEGFYRLKKECVPCEYPRKEKNRCEIFTDNTCSCTKCKSEFKFCKGRCFDNHVNCRTYDSNQNCKCINCETGFKNVGGRCVKEVPHCAKYNENGKCISCETGKTFCNNSCVSNKCVGGTKLDLSLCTCVCPPNTELCGTKCVKPVCKCPWQYFSFETCKCECKEAAFPCRKSCRPFVNNCKSYRNDTCKCKFCNPGFKLCNEKCIPFKCNVNEYFVDAICQCDCKEGFFRNEKGICTSTEKVIEYSIFFKLFLEIIYSFLPPGQGFCHRNEFYSSWALKLEETCRGPRTPNSLEKCFCRNGFIRDIRTNTCMKVCPLPGKPCDTHEVYECGPERYCNKKPLIKLGRLINIEAGVNEGLVDVEVVIGNETNKRVKRKNTSELVDVDISLITNDSSSDSEDDEDEIVDVSASVLRVASVDAEIGEKGERTNDPNNKKSARRSSSVSDDGILSASVLEVVSVEISGSSNESEENGTTRDLNSTSSSESELLDATVEVDLGTGNKNVLFITTEEFCGYHCREGYGRHGSICKKC